MNDLRKYSIRIDRFDMRRMGKIERSGFGSRKYSEQSVAEPIVIFQETIRQSKCFSDRKCF
jgi:hypothetical protein